MSATMEPLVTEAPPTKPAIGWLLFLGAFFFSTYSLSNWLASTRTDVASIVFGWELDIPFLPWTIVPYWSIDLLYAVSLFVCATRCELETHAKRLLLAQIIAVLCFLLVPLHFTFQRPITEGLFGSMFDVLTGFDKPFNQAPSLHIALLVILWTLYARHIAVGWRWALHAWFALIGVSVLTTYQHHFIDIPTGVWLGWICIWAIPDRGPSPLAEASLTQDVIRLRLALRYMIGGVAVVMIALYFGGWALWLLWIAGSLLLVASIYAFLDSAGFQKDCSGAMSIASLWLLAPYISAAWINSRIWTRRSPAPAEVVPGLWIGRLPSLHEPLLNRTRAIVDLTAELPCPVRIHCYSSITMLDLVIPTSRQLDRAIAAIDAALNVGPTLVCCALGYSRSAVVVAAWLLSRRHVASPSDAIELVRRARPHVVLTEKHVAALQDFAAISSPTLKSPCMVSLESEWTAKVAAALALGARWLAGTSLVISGLAFLIMWSALEGRPLVSTTLSLLFIACAAQVSLIVRIELDRQLFDQIALQKRPTDAALEVLDSVLRTLNLRTQTFRTRSLHDRAVGLISFVRLMGYILAMQIALALTVCWIAI